MNAEGLEALFAPFAAVSVKPMFGGHGVYSVGLCFAIQIRGEVFLKCDSQSQPSFVAAGSSPFVYKAKGRRKTTSFWRLPADAHDEPEELRRWAALGLDAARRVAAAKSKPAKGKAAKTPAAGRAQAK
jgi:DNA transformation protein and related proteins